MPKFLAINRCPIHTGVMSVSVDDADGGRRLTPHKCCGQWVTVKRWEVDEEMVADFLAVCGVNDVTLAEIVANLPPPGARR